MPQKDKRLLNAAAPGVISNLIHSSFAIGTCGYAVYVWKNLGLLGFARPAVTLPLFGIVGTWMTTNYVTNYIRELQWTSSRSKMVSLYKDQWGEKFLLDVLEPSFRLPQELDPK